MTGSGLWRVVYFKKHIKGTRHETKADLIYEMAVIGLEQSYGYAILSSQVI